MDAIVAVDRNWAIGFRGGLLTHLSADLRHFKEMTLGKPVLMGRSTLESLPGGRPLPGRRNLVLSASLPEGEGYTLLRSLAEACRCAAEEPELMLIGGASVYAALLPCCERVYVTKMDAAFPADCYFPDLDRLPDWQVEEEGPLLEENGLRFRYVTYRRCPETLSK